MKPYYMAINEAARSAFIRGIRLKTGQVFIYRHYFHTFQLRLPAEAFYINIIMLIECYLAIELHINECNTCSANLLLFIFGIIALFLLRASSFDRIFPERRSLLYRCS